MPLSVILSFVLGCQGGQVEPGTNDSAPPSCDYDDECSSDEFCHDGVCQAIDDRAFTIEPGQLILPTDDDHSVCDFEVDIVHPGGSCVSRRPADSPSWDARCDWTADFDDPELTLELVETSKVHDYCDYDIRFDLSGVEQEVFLVRVGLVGLGTSDGYELWVGITPNF